MVPPGPTAVPVFASLKDTLIRLVMVPLFCAFQVAPPSVLRRILPELPTVTTVLASGADTA
jgi:hypothetical protein